MRPAKTLFPLLLSVVFLTIISCSSSDDGDPVVPDESTPITLTTTAVTNVTQVMATTGGEISGGQGQTILSKGVVWSTSSNPTINNNVVESGSGEGDFTSEIRGLDITTNYFVRAYVTTDSGTTYGNEISFTTLDHVIFNGVIILSSQSNVDGFGSQGYSKVEGGIIIDEQSPNTIFNLDALESLVEIESGTGAISLSIIDNTSLTDISGLNNLRSVTGSIGISGNAINSLIGLNSLETVGETLQINEASIQNFQGLENLKSIGETFAIESDGLVNFRGLNSLESVGNSLVVNSESMNFQDFTGLENLTTIGGSLSLMIRNANYTLNGLSNLEVIGTNLSVQRNDGLESLSGFDSLNSIDQLFIIDNASLIEVTSFSGITVLSQGAVIIDNPILGNLNGLSDLTTIGNSLNIEGSEVLENLDFLSNLNSIALNLDIRDNTSLTNLCGLQTLLLNDGLGGNYRVIGNAYNPTEQDIIDGNCSL